MKNLRFTSDGFHQSLRIEKKEASHTSSVVLSADQ